MTSTECMEFENKNINLNIVYNPETIGISFPIPSFTAVLIARRQKRMKIQLNHLIKRLL